MGEWTVEDLRGTLRVLPMWWDLMTEGVRDVALEELRAEAEARVEALDGPDDPAAAPAVDSALADLAAAGRVVAGLGVVPSMKGTVTGLHVSDGGVPKHPVETAEVERHGLVGDRQRSRRHHGRLWQALCLWSAEVIEALRAEGHPVAAGSTGENLTLSGLDWATLRPGVRLRVGEVLAEVSLPALPCANNARWFIGGDFMRMDHERHPGSSRWYASVLEPGHVRTGDEVVVEP